MLNSFNVVLKRDMSLNRRLHTWLEKSPGRVIEVLRTMINSDEQDLPLLQKPFQIMVFLLDRSELGEMVFEELMIDLICSLYLNLQQHPEMSATLLPVATALFTAIQPFLIWKTLQLWILNYNSCITEKRMVVLKGIEFFLGNFQFEDDETHRVHLPLMYYSTAKAISGFVSNKNLELLKLHYSVLKKILSLIPNNVFNFFWTLADFRGQNKEQKMDSTTLSSPFVVTTPSEPDQPISMDDIIKVYLSPNDVKNLPKGWLTSAIIGSNTLVSTFQILFTLNDEFKNSFAKDSIILSQPWAKHCYLLRQHLKLAETLPLLSLNELTSICDATTSKHAFVCGLNLLLDAYVKMGYRFSHQFFVRSFEQIWTFISVPNSELNLELFLLIARLDDVIGLKILDSCIATTLHDKDRISKIGNLEKFGLLFQFNLSNRPEAFYMMSTFFILEMMHSDELENKMISTQWYQDNVDSSVSIMKPLLKVLVGSGLKFNNNNQQLHIVQGTNLAQLNYFFELVLTLIKIGKSECIQQLSIAMINFKQQIDIITPYRNNQGEITYLEFLLWLSVLVSTSLIAAESELSNQTELKLRISSATCVFGILKFRLENTLLECGPILYTRTMKFLTQEIERSNPLREKLSIEVLTALIPTGLPKIAVNEPSEDLDSLISNFKKAMGRNYLNALAMPWVDAIIDHLPWISEYAPGQLSVLISVTCQITNELALFVGDRLSNQRNRVRDICLCLDLLCEILATTPSSELGSIFIAGLLGTIQNIIRTFILPPNERKINSYIRDSVVKVIQELQPRLTQIYFIDHLLTTFGFLHSDHTLDTLLWIFDVAAFNLELSISICLDFLKSRNSVSTPSNTGLYPDYYQNLEFVYGIIKASSLNILELAWPSLVIFLKEFVPASHSNAVIQILCMILDEIWVRISKDSSKAVFKDFEVLLLN